MVSNIECLVQKVSERAFKRWLEMNECDTDVESERILNEIMSGKNEQYNNWFKNEEERKMGKRDYFEGNGRVVITNNVGVVKEATKPDVKMLVRDLAGIDGNSQVRISKNGKLYYLGPISDIYDYLLDVPINGLDYNGLLRCWEARPSGIVNTKRKGLERPNLKTQLNYTNEDEMCQITMSVPLSVKNEIWDLCEFGHYDLDSLMLAQLIGMLEKKKGNL